MKYPIKKTSAKSFKISGIILAITILALNIPLLVSAFDGGLDNKIIAVAPHLEKDDAIIRSWITYQSPAGKNITDSVDVQNISGENVSLNINFSEASNTDKDHFTLKTDADSKENIAKWLTLESDSEISLNPGEIRNVPLTISIPDDVKAGEYWGGITFEETNASLQNKRDSELKEDVKTIVKTRLAIRTLVKITDKKDASVERLLLATKPNLGDAYDTGLIGQIKKLSIFARIYLSLTLGYFVAVTVWLFYETFKRKNKAGKIIKTAWIYLLILFGLLIGLIRILPVSQNLNGLVSVLNSGGTGLSIAPSPLSDEAGNITERPSWFIFKGNPGETITGKAIVQNHDDTSVYAMVYGVDATITSEGGYALESMDNEAYDIGKWLIVDEPEFYIEAQSTKEVNFSIKLPDNLAPGDHAGGLIVQSNPNIKKVSRIKAEEKAAPAKTSVSVMTRVGARIYLTATGEAVLSSESSDFKVEEKDDGSFIFKYSITNTGNLRFKPHTTLTLQDENGQPLKDPFQVPDNTEMFPGKTATITTVLPWKTIKPGKYKLLAKVNDTKNDTEKTLDFEVFDYSHGAAKIVTQQVVTAAPAAVAAPQIVQAAGIPTWVYITIGGIGLLVLILLIVLVIILVKRKNPPVPYAAPVQTQVPGSAQTLTQNPAPAQAPAPAPDQQAQAPAPNQPQVTPPSPEQTPAANNDQNTPGK